MPKISLDNTFLLNFTDLDVQDTNFFFTRLVALGYRFWSLRNLGE